MTAKKSIDTVALEIQRAIIAAERDNARSLASQARLCATVLDSSIELGAAACLGHSTFERLAAGFEEMARSRSTLVRAHSELAELGREAGWTPRMFGSPTPKFAAELREQPRLSAVESDAA